MRKFLTGSALVLIVGAYSFVSQATEDSRLDVTAAASIGQNCKMVETITFGVNFSNINVEIGNAKTFMDSKIAEIEAAAKDVGIKKFEIQSSNMSVYSNNYTGGTCAGAPAAPAQYMLNGGTTYALDDAEKASALAKAIEAKGYQVNLSTNAYRQCQ